MIHYLLLIVCVFFFSCGQSFEEKYQKIAPQTFKTMSEKQTTNFLGLYDKIKVVKKKSKAAHKNW